MKKILCLILSIILMTSTVSIAAVKPAKPLKSIAVTVQKSKPVTKTIVVKHNEEVDARLSGVKVQTIADATKVNKYQRSISWNTITYEVNYSKAEIMLNNKGTVDLAKNANALIRKIKAADKYMFTSSDGKVKYMCLPGRVTGSAISFAPATVKYVTAGNPVICVLTVMELAYDKGKDRYFVRSIVEKDVPSGKLIPVKGKKNKLANYIAITRFIAKPIDGSGTAVVSQKAGITVKPISEAWKTKEYVDKVNYGHADDRDPDWKKYVNDEDMKKGIPSKYQLLTGRNGTEAFGTAADSGIRELFKLEKIGLVTSADGKESYYCVQTRPGCNFSNPSTAFMLMPEDEPINQRIINGSKMIYVLALFELAYDQKQDLYYVKSYTTKDIGLGSMKIINHKVDDPIRYIALPKLILEPTK